MTPERKAELRVFTSGHSYVAVGDFPRFPATPIEPQNDVSAEWDEMLDEIVRLEAENERLHRLIRQEAIDALDRSMAPGGASAPTPETRRAFLDDVAIIRGVA